MILLYFIVYVQVIVAIMNNARSSNKSPLNAMLFLCIISLIVLLTAAQDTIDDVEEFTKWLHDHGSKFRCLFRKNKMNNDVEVIADRRIHDRESVFMIPQTLLVNSTVIDG